MSILFDSFSDCRCSATSDIKQLSDFHPPEDVRLQQVMTERIENEKKIAEMERTKKAEMLQTEQTEMAKKQQAEQRMLDFYTDKACPKCAKKLRQRPGKIVPIGFV